MPAPTITPLPPAPLRSQNPATFASQAETFVDALEELPDEINAFGEYLDSYTPPGGYTDAQARAAIHGAPTTQAGTSYTAVLADAYSYIQFTNGAAVAFTIPPNSAVAFAVGTVITVEQNGAGAVTFTPGSGVTLNSRGGLLDTAGQYAVAQLKKVAADTWTVIGDVA